MTGSKTKAPPGLTRKQALEALKTPPPNGYFVWDGKDEDDRPLTPDEMRTGIEAARRQAGRPLGSGRKESTTIRFDTEVLDAFRASGAGWQTRMNDALRDWLKSHSPAA